MRYYLHEASEVRAANEKKKGTTMETATMMLKKMKNGFVTILWDRIVIRVGDKFIVGESPSIHETPITLEEAATILARKN